MRCVPACAVLVHSPPAPLPSLPSPPLACSILFPTVDVLPIAVLFDPQRLTAALSVEGALRLRWAGLRLPLLVHIIVELAPRRERGAAAGSLCIT